MTPDTSKNILPSLQLKDENIQKQFRRKLDEIILSQNIEQAYLFSIVLRDQLNKSEDFKRIDQTAYEQYEKMIIQAQWIALLNMRQEQVRSLIGQNLVEGIEMEDFGILQAIRTRLLLELDVLKRDKFKKELLSDLRLNTQSLTNEVIRSRDKRYLPTVKQWIQEYIEEIGSDNLGDRLKQAQFFSANSNVRKLSPEEKRRLEIVVHIYERLAADSSSKEGIEEAIPIDDPKRKGVLREGIFEEIKPYEMEKELKYAESIAEAVEKRVQEGVGKQPTSLEAQERHHIADMPRIREQVAKIVPRTKGQIDKIEEIFVKAIKDEDTYSVLAALYYLAGKKAFQNFLLSRKDWVQKVSAYIAIQYPGKKISAFITNNLSSPEVIQGLIRYILQDQMRLPEYRVALIAIDIGKLLGSEYEKMAYPDSEKKSYVWTKIKAEGEKLILEEPPKMTISEEEVLEEEEVYGESLDELLEFAKKRMKETFVAESVLMGKVGENAVELKKQLVNALKTRDADKAVGALLILSKIGKLQQALKESGNWRETLKNYIADKYNSQALKQFVEENPTDPTVVSEFLQYVLQDRLGFKESEAAVVGMEVGDRMGGKYQTMSAADEENNMFSWIPNKVEDGKLVPEVK
ncbi:hypothetical protein ACFL0L_01020 [Patescibacteria group bacterium]